MGINFDDDPTFKALSSNKDIHTKRLSWQCANLLCAQCDGFIHYKFKKVKTEYFNLKTGRKEQEIEDFEWDTEFNQVQIDGGQIQTKENTPEGSRCECHHCHGRPRYKEWVEGQGQPFSIGKITITDQTKGYTQKELSDEERDKLK